MEASGEISDRIKDLAARYLEANGLELVEIIYRREQPGMVLRLLVDTPEGVRIDECEALNNFLSGELDRNDIIGEHFVLEVASPGLDRPFKTDRDFERSLGKEIEVTTYEPVDGRKTHEGVFAGMDRDKIVILAGDIGTVIPRNTIALARRRVKF